MTARGSMAHPAGTGDGIAFCFVGHERYAILDADVRFIGRVEQMRQDRGTDGRLGMLLSGGRPVPVYSLAAQLGRPAGLSTANHIVVTSGAGESVGWLVDRVARSQRGQRLDVLPLPAIVGPVATRWFKGLLKFEDRACLVVSPADLDPRASSRPPVAPAPRLAPLPAAAPMGAGVSMVVMFSSRAVPACGAQQYGLSARQVAAVVPSLPAIPIPGNVRHVNGLAWWRDAAVPIVDFRDAAARANDRTGNRHLIVYCGAKLQGALVALPIGADVTLYRATEHDRPVVTGTAPPEFVLGVFRIGGERLALLDLDVLVGRRAGGAAWSLVDESDGGTQLDRRRAATAETHS